MRPHLVMKTKNKKTNKQDILAELNLSDSGSSSIRHLPKKEAKLPSCLKKKINTPTDKLVHSLSFVNINTINENSNILGMQNFDLSSRLDKFGNDIKQGNKFRISFADNFDSQMVEVKSVVSFKEFNKLDPDEIHFKKNLCKEFCVIL